MTSLKGVIEDLNQFLLKIMTTVVSSSQKKNNWIINTQLSEISDDGSFSENPRMDVRILENISIINNWTNFNQG